MSLSVCEAQMIPIFNGGFFFLVPFAIDAIERGRSPDDSDSDPYKSKINDPGSVSKESGVLLALFSVGIIVGSLGFGYFGNHNTNKQKKKTH